MYHYNSFNMEMRRRYGKKVYKIALDGGFTCPNRDGTAGYGGCIFCSQAGSGDFTFRGENISRQIDLGISLVREKAKNGLFVGYFQSFTNTYAPYERLKCLFESAVYDDRLAALSIATRPDCLPEETVELLAGLNRIKPVWVELGLQTIREDTARYIRRGYTLDVYDEAVKKLRDRDIEVITHMIIGLPGETPEDMANTAGYIGLSGAGGIKLQLLHVLRGTDLEQDYHRGLVTLPTLEEYTEILARCIRVLPPEMVVHRLTGDGAKSELVAPMWSGDKKRVLNAINRAFDRLGLVQGSEFPPKLVKK